MKGTCILYLPTTEALLQQPTPRDTHCFERGKWKITVEEACILITDTDVTWPRDIPPISNAKELPTSQ